MNTPAAPRTLHLGRTQQTVGAALAQRDGQFVWAPVFAAMAIDVADFFSVGPVGWAAGLVLGGALTVAVSLAAGAKLRRALLFGVLGGLYCAMPLTGAVPLATMLTLVYGFMQRSQAAEPAEFIEAEVVERPVAGRVSQIG